VESDLGVVFVAIFWREDYPPVETPSHTIAEATRLISLPMTFFAQRRVGELASRLSSDLIQIEDTLIVVLPQFIRQTTILIGGIALIAVTSLQLTGVLLLSLPVLTVAAMVFGRKTRKISREAQDRLADTATIVEETLQGIVNVKAFANEGHELNRYHEGLGRFLTSALRAARLRSAFIAFIIFALFGGIVLVLWSGARLLQRGEITFGDLTRFGLYTTFVAGAMGQFAELYSQLQKAIGATQRVRELLRETGEVELFLARHRHPVCPDCGAMWCSRMSTSVTLRDKTSKFFTQSTSPQIPDKGSRSSARAVPANPR
jgi:ATP-binding cassette subfamily B protein